MAYLMNKITGSRIVGTSDTVPCTAHISNPRMENDKLVFDWAGESEVYWNDQKTRLDGTGKRLFRDEDGAEVFENDIVLMQENQDEDQDQ